MSAKAANKNVSLLVVAASVILACQYNCDLVPVFYLYKKIKKTLPLPAYWDMLYASSHPSIQEC